MGNSSSAEIELAVLGAALIKSDIPHTDRATWSKLWSLPTQSEQIFDSFTLEMLRNVRDRRPTNLCSLVKLLVMEVTRIVSTVKQLSAINTKSQSAEQYLSTHTQSLINCLRILTRCLAVINENPQSPLASDFMFGGCLPGVVEQHEREQHRRAEEAKRKAKQADLDAQMVKEEEQRAAERAREEERRRKEREQIEKTRIEAEAKEAMERVAREQHEAAEKLAAQQSKDAEYTPPSASHSGASSPFGANHRADEESQSEQFENEEQLSDEQPAERPKDGSESAANEEPSDAAQSTVPSPTAEQSIESSESNFEFMERQSQQQPIAIVTTSDSIAATNASTENGETDQPPQQQRESAASEPASPTRTQPTAAATESGTAAQTDAAEARDQLSETSRSTESEKSETATGQQGQPSSTAAVSRAAITGTPSTTQSAVLTTPRGPPVDAWWFGSLYGESLASLIIRLLTDCCFLPGFTIPTEAMPVSKQELHLGKCWESGVGFPPQLVTEALTTAGMKASSQWQLDQHRVDVLRCLLVACSSSMFLPTLVDTPPDRWIQTLVAPASSLQQSQSLSLTLLYSLLNLVLSYRPEGALPYSAMLATDYRQPCVELAVQLLMILLDYRDTTHPQSQSHSQPAASTVELHEKRKRKSKKSKPSNGDAAGGEHDTNSSDDTSEAAAVISQPSVSVNADAAETEAQQSATMSKPFSQPRPTIAIPHDEQVSAASVTTHRHTDPNEQRRIESERALPTNTTPSNNLIFSRLFQASTPADLSYVYTSVCRLLHQGLIAQSTWMPGSAASITIESELFVLLWKFLDECSPFAEHIVQHCDILSLVTPLLYYIYDARHDTAKLGVMYTCTFMLLKLSGERDFSVALNKKLPAASLSHIPIAALLDMHDNDVNYADALILVAHRFILSSPAHLDASLYGALLKVMLTLLANISPYITKLSPNSALRILGLMELFTAPGFLYAQPQNHQYALLMLDFLNNQIQYQFAGSAHLILNVVKRAKLFYALRVFEQGAADAHIMKGVGARGHQIVVQSAQAQLQRRSSAISSATSSTAAVTAEDESATGESASEPVSTTASTASTPATSSPSSRYQAVQGQLNDASPVQPEALPDLSTFGTHGFVPTHQWANQWKARLPLDPIYRMLDFLVPKVDTMSRSAAAVLTDAALLDFIKSTTLVGVLPVPHPIVVRRYIRNPFTNQWFQTYIFGIIFLRNQNPKMFDGKKVSLFSVTNRGGESGQERQQDTRPTPLPQPQQLSASSTR